jgi:hypothetical protein
VSEHELEQHLRSAMRPVDPGADFCERVLARIEASQAPRRPTLARWGSLSLAACVLAGIGLAHWHQQVQQQRGVQASEQLLQALNIVSVQLSDVRALVGRQEDSPR